MSTLHASHVSTVQESGNSVVLSFVVLIIIIIIIHTFVTRTVSANILNLRRRQSLGEVDGGSEV